MTASQTNSYTARNNTVSIEGGTGNDTIVVDVQEPIGSFSGNSISIMGGQGADLITLNDTGSVNNYNLIYGSVASLGDVINGVTPFDNNNKIQFSHRAFDAAVVRIEPDRYALRFGLLRIWLRQHKLGLEDRLTEH